MGVLKNGIGRPSNETIKKRNIFKILCLVLFIAVIGLVAYILNDKGIIKTSESTEKSESIKLDDNKDYVYDANYDYDKTNYEIANHEVFTGFNLLKVDRKENYYDDLNTPYINIDSKDAKKVNNELKELFDSYIKKINEEIIPRVINKEELYYESYHILYKSFINKDILSVVVEYGMDGTSAPSYNYVGYNFSLEDGKLLNTKDSNLKSKLKTAVSNYAKETNEEIREKYNYDTVDEQKSLDYIDNSWNEVNEIYSMFEEENNSGIVYFVENDKINFITYIYNINSELCASPVIFKIN